MLEATVLACYFGAGLLPVHVHDVYRFIETKEHAFHAFNVANQIRLGVAGNEWDEKAFNDQWWRYKCWDLLDDVKWPRVWTDDQMREKLFWLRASLGPQRYYLGQMPEPYDWRQFWPSR